MLSYTVYSEAGGVGKTTLAANLAVAHARAGLNPLVVPLDPQDGDLSRLFGVDEDRSNSDVDTLVRHLVNSPRGPFQDLIRSAEGVDIIPEHNMLADLDTHLRREQDKAEELGDTYNIYAQLLRVLEGANIPDQYDVLICDPPATESIHLYNAIYATRNLLIPIEPSAKGQAAVEGLEQLATNFGDQLSIDVGVLAAVPNGVKNTSDQQAMLDKITFPTPVIINDRTSLMEGCWNQQCSAFRYVQDHRSPRRDYELETLQKIDELARFLENQAEIKAPHPPNAGTLEETS